MRTKYFPLVFLFIPCSIPTVAASAESVQLARDGASQQAIVVAVDATESIRQSAATLAEYLQRICGAKFQVITGDGSSGIAVGLAAHFPALRLKDAWLQPGLFDREKYLLRSHAQGVYVVGATELAVEHAVWDLLYRIGYRQFFPGKTWEVVPAIRDLSIAVDVEESPDYHSRRIWYGFGPWDYAEEPYRQWCRRNRTASALALNTGHAYGGIVSAKRAEFAQHPEYFALVGGQRQSGHENAKFCISNPGLRKLVVQYASEYFDKNPEADSVSVDPSDGGGWCECEACAQMGSVSDRALTLANDVAAAVGPRGKLVGMYAYSYHSPPPQIRVHPQVIISVATAFIKGGLTVGRHPPRLVGPGRDAGHPRVLQREHVGPRPARPRPRLGFALPGENDPGLPRPGRPVPVRRVQRQLGAQRLGVLRGSPHSLGPRRSQTHSGTRRRFSPPRVRPGARTDG